MGRCDCVMSGRLDRRPAAESPGGVLVISVPHAAHACILACLLHEDVEYRDWGLLDSRIAIGLGPAESLGTADLSDARGAAFEASGRGLDGMGRQRQLAVAGPGVTALHRVIVELLEEHARRWTREQAEAAALWLHPGNPTLADVAPRLGITPQAVNYRLSGGSVQAIRRALAGWEAALAGGEDGA